MNNTVPLSGLRNEIGKVMTPYTRELGSDLHSSIRNRNLITENIAANPLPIKYDMLNGKPIKNYDFFTRAFNAVSPVSLNLSVSPGRQFLFESGYDLRMSTYYAPDSTNLTDNPRVRSEFQRLIGEQNLERELDKLAVDPKILASMEQMYADIKAGKRAQYDARDYYHNQMIDRLYKRARVNAWRKLTNYPNIAALISKQKVKKEAQIQKQFASSNILSMYK